MIHPTAIIDPQAKLGEGVQVGPYAIVEGPCVIGAGTVLMARSHVIGHTTMGARNILHPGAVIGGTPQDKKYKESEISQTIIGDDNVFREGVTIHRGTGAGTKTVIGSRGYFMACSHVGHNCRVWDDVTMINNSALAGHVEVFPRAIIGFGCAVHQFCRVGRLAMMSDSAGMNQDLPPFFTTMTTNRFNQLNLVGMRRAGIPRENITAVRQMFQLAFRSDRLLANALADLPESIAAVAEVRELLEFVKGTKRGIARWAPWSGKSDDDE
jgi:UDP-N-acetylglucosamine acyltransferase